MVQGQHINTGTQFDLLSTARGSGEEHILRRGQAVHGGGVMLGQMVGIEARRIKAFNLRESIVINLVQFLTRNGLDMIKHTKLKTHVLSLLLAVLTIDAACLMAVES